MNKNSIKIAAAALAVIGCGVLQAGGYAQPPARIAISILSPGSELYAGNEFTAEVRVYDANGLITGIYCTKVAYQDTLGAASGQPLGKVTSDNIEYEMNKWPDTTNRIDQCFVNGIDTVKCVLYNAGTENHKIWARTGSIAGMTDAFALNPGAPVVLRIVNSITNTDTNEIDIYYPTGSVQLTAERYDSWNNNNGRTNCTWTQTGTLHTIDMPFGSQINYGTTGVTSEENGMIIAATTANPIMLDTVNLNVRMPSSIFIYQERAMIEKKDISTTGMFDLRGRRYCNKKEMEFGKGLFITLTKEANGRIKRSLH